MPTAKSFGKWFCGECGSPVPRLTRNGKLFVIPAGSLDTGAADSPDGAHFLGIEAPWGCDSNPVGLRQQRTADLLRVPGV